MKPAPYRWCGLALAQVVLFAGLVTVVSAQPAPETGSRAELGFIVALEQDDLQKLPPPPVRTLPPFEDKLPPKKEPAVVPPAAFPQAAADLTQRPMDLAQSQDRGAAPAGFRPQMIGDFLGTSSVIPFTVLTQTVVTVPSTQLIPNQNQFPNQTTEEPPAPPPTSITFQLPQIPGSPPFPPITLPVGSTVTLVRPNTRTLQITTADRGGYKAAENASPIPVDRIFFTYHYFNRLGQNTGPSPNSGTSVLLVDGFAVKVNTYIPGISTPRFDLHRESFGFEKTFLDGDGSIEVRAPYLQYPGAPASFGLGDGFGDLTAILKLALLYNRQTGDIFSAGLGVTAPTGQGIPFLEGTIRSTLLQPFIGWLWNQPNFYVQGFTSVIFPTDERDITLLFNDFGFNYWLYRAPQNRFLQGIIPTVEAHLTTPLNHRSHSSLFRTPDLLVMTGGVHFLLFNRATLTVGVATPVTGPQPFDLEALAQFNYRF